MKRHPLKIWREAKKLTQEGAARSTGVTVQCWRNWETGKAVPQPEHMRKLAKMIGPGFHTGMFESRYRIAL